MARFHSAVIFDVDGPLLDLTPEETDAYFFPFHGVAGTENLSRDWDTYKVRNDVEIYREILEGLHDRSPTAVEMDDITTRYLVRLEDVLDSGEAVVQEIPGARDLLAHLHSLPGIALGMATANFREAARIRLERLGMWDYVKEYPGAAEYGGVKRDVLARVVADVELPRERIVYLGDNLNDLDAAESNEVHFIGFCTSAERRQRLTEAGAVHVTDDHAISLSLINEFLALH